MRTIILFFVLSAVVFASTNAQTAGARVNGLDKRKLYAYCLDADIKSVMKLITDYPKDSLKESDIVLVKKYTDRFGDTASILAAKGKFSEDTVLAIFQDYWKRALMNEKVDEDGVLWNPLWFFLAKNDTVMFGQPPSYKKLNEELKKYCAKKKWYTTNDVGKTGKLFDFLVWKDQYDTLYRYTVGNDTIEVPVVFLDNFISLGWEEFATFGTYYPGGWATDKAIFCVKKAYQLESENFKISYLAHEGKHFLDTKRFPLLSSAEKEYRAKLIELSLAKKSIYNLIDGFIHRGFGSNVSQDAHGNANYNIITDLSNKLFDKVRITDIGKWKKISIETINNTALALLNENDQYLSKKYQ